MRRTLDTLSRFVPLVLAASPRRAAASALVMVALALTEGVGLLFLIPLLQLVGVDVAEGSLSRIAEAFADVLAAMGVRPTLGAVLGLYVALIALHTLLGRWHTMLSATVQQDTVALLRTRLYQRIARMEWCAFVRRRQSDFVHALTGEIDRAGAASYYLVELAVATLVLGVYLALAMSVSPATTLVVALCGAALALAVRGRLRDSHASGDRSAKLRKRLYAAMADHLSSMKAAKSHDAEQRNAESFVALSHDLREMGLRMTRDSARLRQHTQLGSAVVLAGIVYLARAVIALPTAELLVLLFLFARLLPRLTDLIERAQALAAVLPAFDLVDAVEREATAAAAPTVTRPLPARFRRDIRFDGVAFAYAPGHPPAVSDLDLTIEAGSVTALVGASGAGKTTVVDSAARPADTRRGSHPDRRRTVDRRFEPRRGGARSATCRRMPSSSTTRYGPTCCRRGRRRPRPRFGTPSVWRRPTPSSPAWRRASTPASATVGRCCREASASGWHWRGRCCGSPAC